MNISILFIAPYPSEETIADGYMQRVKNIDNLVSNYKRSYLWIYIKPKHRTETIIVNNYLTIYKVNIFRDIRFIKELLNKYHYIYFHSIYRYSRLFWLINKQKTILDFHGVVPEELRYNKKYIFSLFYALIEKKRQKI